ncbi:MAG: histidine phosphatase family protein [Halothiobacillaceae bacterium]
MTRLDLLRHGEPVGGLRYRGDGVDDPLTAEGLAAMWRAVEGGVWDAVVSSPLQRCRTFADAYAEKSGLPLVIEPRLREIGLGAWEGLSHAEVKRDQPEAYAAYKRDILTGMPAGAEPIPAFIARVQEALGDLSSRHAGQRVLVVCHAVVMRAALAIALDAPPQALGRIRVDYASFLHLRHAHGQWAVEGLGNRGSGLWP